MSLNLEFILDEWEFVIPTGGNQASKNINYIVVVFLLLMRDSHCQSSYTKKKYL